MARNSLKANKARIAKKRREAKAAQGKGKRPWTMMGVAFGLGMIVTTGAFVLTPLGALCITNDKTPAVSVSRDRDKAVVQGDGNANKGDAGPLAKTGDQPKHPTVPGPGDPPGAGKNDPLAELQRVREINARNRKLMEAAAGRAGQPPTPKPPVPQVPKPTIPGRNPAPLRQPTIPDKHPTPTPPRQPGVIPK